MRIAIVGPIYPYRGGIAQYTNKLSTVLNQNHKVRIFSFKRQYPTWLYPGRSDKDPGQKKISLDVKYFIDSLNPISWVNTANQIQDYQPDIVIIEWWVTFLAPPFASIAYLCRRKKLPVIFLIHNVLPHENSMLHKPLAWTTLRQGNHYIVHTPRERERLLALIPGAEPEVCPFPIYDMFKKPTPLTKTEARKQLKLPENGKIMLFFGIVRPYKGLVYLLDALAMLKDKNQDLLLVVAGEFWDEKELYLNKIASLDISDQVHLVDSYIPDEELSTYFQASDLAVAPYVGGTQSAVSALALGFGTPLVATEWSAAGIEEIQDNPLVSVVPAGDPRSLSEAIQDYIDNPPPTKPLEVDDRKGWQELVATIENIKR